MKMKMKNNIDKVQDVKKQSESNSSSYIEKTKTSLAAIKASQKYKLSGLKLEKG